jgi:hypothetical protein
MSQRSVSGSVGVQAEGTPVIPPRALPEVNPLMPASLRRIPGWYEGGGCRHTSRFLVGALPGAFLLITVTGTT